MNPSEAQEVGLYQKWERGGGRRRSSPPPNTPSVIQHGMTTPEPNNAPMRTANGAKCDGGGGAPRPFLPHRKAHRLTGPPNVSRTPIKTCAQTTDCVSSMHYIEPTMTGEEMSVYVSHHHSGPCFGKGCLPSLRGFAGADNCTRIPSPRDGPRWKKWHRKLSVGEFVRGLHK